MSAQLGSKGVSRAVAWVGAASGVVAIFDAISLAILMFFWVSPAQFGIASLATTLFYFLDLVTEAGMSSSLIQHEDADEDRLTSAFWLNLWVSLGAFVLVLGVGPLIGWVQGHAIVGWMLVAYGTKLLYQNIYFVPAALLRREMKFKEISIVRTIANAADGATKVAFAAMNEPIWCFVAGPLARVLVTGIGLQLYRPWRPRGRFDRSIAKGMLTFGFKTTGSQYLAHFYNNISHQIVGFYFGETALGIYRVAYELVLYPVNWVSNVVTTVAFPALARLRSQPEQLAEQFVKLTRQNLATALPILVVLAAAASQIPTLLFPKVGDVSSVVRMLCVVGLLRAIDCLYLPLLDAIGLAGRNLGVAAFAAVVLATGDLVFANVLGPTLGFESVAIARMASYPLVIAVHAWLAIGRLGASMTMRQYLGKVISIVMIGVIATLVGIAVGYVLPASVSIALQLVIIAAASVLVLAVLLEKVHGLGIRAVLRELRR